MAALFFVSMPAICISCWGRRKMASRSGSRSPSTARRPAKAMARIPTPEGEGAVTGQRLYQLIRQQGAIGDHTFAIKFLDPGVQAFAFTFG